MIDLQLNDETGLLGIYDENVMWWMSLALSPWTRPVTLSVWLTSALLVCLLSLVVFIWPYWTECVRVAVPNARREGDLPGCVCASCEGGCESTHALPFCRRGCSGW
jgi:hypothetical protein